MSNRKNHKHVIRGYRLIAIAWFLSPADSGCECVQVYYIYNIQTYTYIYMYIPVWLSTFSYSFYDEGLNIVKAFGQIIRAYCAHHTMTYRPPTDFCSDFGTSAHHTSPLPPSNFLLFIQQSKHSVSIIWCLLFRISQNINVLLFNKLKEGTFIGQYKIHKFSYITFAFRHLIQGFTNSSIPYFEPSVSGTTHKYMCLFHEIWTMVYGFSDRFILHTKTVLLICLVSDPKNRFILHFSFLFFSVLQFFSFSVFRSFGRALFSLRCPLNCNDV